MGRRASSADNTRAKRLTSLERMPHAVRGDRQLSAPLPVTTPHLRAVADVLGPGFLIERIQMLSEAHRVAMILSLIAPFPDVGL